MERAVVGWENFFVAEAGAAAAFAGLIFVAVSINLARILETPSLPGRAGETLILLLALLSTALLGLVPGQPNAVFGTELVAIGGFCFATSLLLQIRAGVSQPRYMGARVLTSFPPPMFVLVAGVSLLSGRAGGLMWLAPASVWGFLGVGLNAWVFLVEILR